MGLVTMIKQGEKVVTVFLNWNLKTNKMAFQNISVCCLYEAAIFIK